MNPAQNEIPSSLYELNTQHSGLTGTENGFTFRDLNKNGKLDIYEDPRHPLEARIEDLLGQMTLEEKAGLLFINGATVNADGSIEDKPGAPRFPRSAATQIVEQKMNHFNLWDVPGAQAVAAWHNNLQRFAEETRLGSELKAGIPVSAGARLTISPL
jgi:beta-glucosidase